MKHRTAGFPLFIFFLILISFSSVSPDNSTPSLSLEGTWKIYFGPEIPPEAFSVDFNDRQWKDIEMPGAFIQAAPGKAGYAWLRKSFSLKGRLASIPLALFIGRIAVADEVYWNGVRIGRMGRMPPAGQELTDNFFSAWNSPRLYEIPSNLIEPDVNTEIVIKIYYSNDGWIQDNMEIGSADALRPRVRLRAFLLNDLNMILAFVLVSVALYHLMLFIKRTSDLENLFFAAACVLSALQSANMGLPDDFPMGYLNKERFVMGGGPLIAPAFVMFFRYFFSLHSKPQKIFSIVYCSIIVVISFYVMASPSLPEIRARYNIALPTGAIALVYILVAIGIGWKRKNPNAPLMAFSVAVLGALAIHDIVAALTVTRGGIYLFTYALPILMFSIALVLANDFMRTRRQVEELNAKLEQKVEERTKKLSESYQSISELKAKQDGDYFLTSLLTQPLGGSSAQSQNVHIDILVNSYKKFRFQKWDSELGGDLCAAASIRLRGKSYVAFLNGDAMGKSMQGAGGVLVLGTAFKTIVTRTQQTEALADKYPEIWLKESLVDLQKIFVSFDGSMLVSCVIGLLDENSGFVYFLNAEHPQVVLYREKKASFIPGQRQLLKIGVPEIEGGLYINTCQLHKEDVLILGSDGRDDILLGEDAQGTRIINEDENVFLRCVEAAAARLESIEEEITKKGKLTDDLSLLRIGYREDAPLDVESPEFGQLLKEAGFAIEKSDMEGAEKLLTEAGRYGLVPLSSLIPVFNFYKSSKRFQDAYRICVFILELHPSESEFLYQAAYTGKAAFSQKQKSLLAEAALCGERYRLRNPDDIRNLINLSDIYRLLGDRRHAGENLARAERLDPTNPSLLKLKNLTAL